MEFKELMKLLPEDDWQEIEVYMGSWEMGSITFSNSVKHSYLINKLGDCKVVGISTYGDVLQVVLI